MGSGIADGIYFDATLMPTGSYSELFDSDPDYVAALATVPLSGQEAAPMPSTNTNRSVSSPRKKLKRVHSDDDSEGDSHDQQSDGEDNGKSNGLGTVHYLSPYIPSGTGSVQSDHTSATAIYGASKFGGWSEYMGRKRAKLQIQNREIAESSPQKPQIFKGVQIYVRKWT
jgi:DNA repair protein REV1